MRKNIKSLLIAFPIISFLSQEVYAQAYRTDKDSVKIYHLEEITISSTRAGVKTPISFTNIDKSKIKKVNYGQDIPYILGTTPSVVSTSDGGIGIGYTGFRVRGTDASRINITTNGIPLNDSESQAVFWVNMPDFINSVQDLQVQRGVGTSSNGAGAFGASINMKTEGIKSKPYAEVGVSGGSYGVFRRSVKAGTGIINDHWSLDTRFSKLNSDGFVDRSGVKLKSYFIQGAYSADNSVLKLITFGGNEVTGIAWNGISPEDIKSYGRRYNTAGLISKEDQTDPKNFKYYRNTDNYDQRHYQAIFSHVLTPALNLNINGHYTRGKGYTDEYRTNRKFKKYGLVSYKIGDKDIQKSDLIRRKYLDNHFYGGNASLVWSPERLNLTLGLSANQYKGDHFGEIKWIKNYNKALDPNHRYYEGDGRKTDFLGFLKLNYELLQGLNIYADLQMRHINYHIDGTIDHYDENTKDLQVMHLKRNFNFFNPKAGLFYQFNSNHQGYASVAVAHREPSRNNYTESGADAYPEAERLIDYELGYKYVDNNIRLGANLYYMSYKDQLLLNGRLSDVGEMLTVNVPKSSRMGLELSSNWKIASWLQWDVAFTLSSNQIKDYKVFYSVYDAQYNWLRLEEKNLKNAKIAFSPEVIASTGFTANWKNFEIALTGQYVGKQYLDNTENDARKLPSYFVSNLRLGYDFRAFKLANCNLGLQVNNLFNKDYSSNGYVYDNGFVQKGQSLEEYSDIRLFPQAGTHVLGSLTITF
ncbi:TonB-dependent receptor [Porphyromonas pogonae]|uniref:TonB-dependent receptor n=1 Tax=Porphyromonas pogonae TaxID=867595 RepID=UPI002E7615D7|nr:TonB-dependent receptor [Porphyromonas pogonae]